MIGEKYGKWEVIEVIKGNSDNNWHTLWRCRCECGVVRKQEPSNLKSGKSRSCRKCSVGMTTHGLYKHKLYAIWTAMKQRCTNPDNKYYPNYGGRGITVCNEWVDDPEIFISWGIGNGWRNGLQLDRKDNDGPYSPDNCRFITQERNLRNSRTLTTRNNSGYRGVSEIKQQTQTIYRAKVTCFNKVQHIGHFRTADEAALARDKFCVDNNLPLPLNFPIKSHDREKLEEELEEKNVSR